MSDVTAGRAFAKMHGLRNHFVIVDARAEPFAPAADEIVRICDVQVGVGADQLIVVEPSRRADVDAFMRIYNRDGREAEACGNATRCVAWMLFDEVDRDAVVIETLAGALRCEHAGELRVRCEMGKVTMDWRAIPLASEQDTLHLAVDNGPLEDAVGVGVGNPHAVFFVPDLDAVDVERHAPDVQRHAVFPQQANVGVAEVVDAAHMRLAVYERGAGLTMACGSGACAAVYAARARGLTDGRRVRVDLAGGPVTIEIRDDDVAVMTGPVAHSFTGRL